MGKNTLTQQVIQDILVYIRSEGLQAGDFLPTEDKMRAIFNVSRPSLREACAYLKGIGILTSRRGSGFKVSEGDFVTAFEMVLRQISSFDKQHLSELLELRKTLEIGSIHDAVLNAAQADIEKIFAAVDKMDEFIPAGKVNTREYNSVEAEFHQAIIAPAGCRILGIINAAVTEFFRASSLTFPQNTSYDDALATAKRSNTEHRQIAIAFKLRQPDAALLALTKHFK